MSRATAKERAQFMAALLKAFPEKDFGEVEQFARLMLRHAATHGRLAEETCNGHPIQGQYTSATGDALKAHNARVTKLQNQWDARIEKKELQVEARMKVLCDAFGVELILGGDPRGYTVKIKLPNGASNTWGGAEDGFGVPQ
jgi:hypothetical protein